MKTGQFGRTAWLAVVTAVMMAAGCGARTLTEVPAPDSTNTVVAVAGTNAPAAGEAAPDAEPAPVKRSETPTVALPPEVSEVVKLVESGAGDEVVRAYVGTSLVPFELSLDQIIYLRDIGISDGVIAAMMRRGSELRDRANETEAMHTNLVAAVDQIRQAIATNGPATAADAAAGAPVVPPPESTPPATSPVVATAPAAPADAPQEVAQFYSSLSPYGTWYQVPSYGWVWQPSVVVVNGGWSPYCHGGHWVWSDWGWYWASDYSWGWAPFHYGRWSTYPGLGWCWVPGSVWGPSWVTWRHCDSHIGWAPLPPACGWSAGVGLTWHGGAVSVGFGFGLAASCYTFVSYDHFCHRNVGHYGVSGHHAPAVYNQTTVVNNVIHGNNNVIVNNGVGFNNVATRTRNEIPKVRVRDLPGDASRPMRADRVERARDGMVVYKPTAAPARPGEAPQIRSEVRPSVSTPTTVGAVPSRGEPGPGTPPSRPNPGSRSGGSTSFSQTSKPVDSRGAPSGFTAGGTPSGRVSAPTTPATPSRPSYATSGTAGSRPVSTAPKGVETRGAPAASGGGAVPAGVSSPGSAVVGPARQTTPVPLGDPSRNLPTGARAPAPRTVAPAAPTAKPVNEGRSVSGVPSAPVRSYDASPRGVATPNAAPVGRNMVSTPSSMTVNSRPSAPVYTPPASSMAPRATYSAPAPMAGPSAAPRATYSAPSPSYGPSPAAAAPRGSMNTPSPSAGSPSSRGGSGGSSRNQPN